MKKLTLIGLIVVLAIALTASVAQAGPGGGPGKVDSVFHELEKDYRDAETQAERDEAVEAARDLADAALAQVALIPEDYKVKKIY